MGETGLRSVYQDIPIIDCHAHIMGGIDGINKLIKTMQSFNFETMNVLSVSGAGDASQNFNCALYKAINPGKAYAFGGLVHPRPDTGEEKLSYYEQAKALLEMGFDGIKMIEGKPSVAKELKKPLNHPDYDKFYELLESEGTPILFHVADPETFWDEKAIPEWAKAAGWFYGDGTYPGKEDLYAQIEDILSRFPRLNAIFAHFYFMSADMDRAIEFLEKWPSVKFDITPGIEMYENFSKGPVKWREFFIKYQDRILFGTDSYDANDPTDRENINITVNVVRGFLETDRVRGWDKMYNGISLGRSELENIYYKNFQRYVGCEPKRLNAECAIEYCEIMIRFAQDGLIGNGTIGRMHEALKVLKDMVK